MTKIIGTRQYEMYKLDLFEKKNKHIIISEISWCYVLQRAGSDYCVNDNFPGTFTDFCLQIFTQKKITSYRDRYP